MTRFKTKTHVNTAPSGQVCNAAACKKLLARYALPILVAIQLASVFAATLIDSFRWLLICVAVQLAAFACAVWLARLEFKKTKTAKKREAAHG